MRRGDALKITEVWDEAWLPQFAAAHPKARVGEHCLFMAPDKVRLRGPIRIDPFFLSTCGIDAAGMNHVGPNVFFNGGPGQTVRLGEWAFVGAGSRLITASDDYSGAWGPIGPYGSNFMERGDIVLAPFSGVAVGTTLLPGVELPEGVCIAAHGLVRGIDAEQMEPWTVYACVPGREPKRLYSRDEDSIRRLAEDKEFLK